MIETNRNIVTNKFILLRKIKYGEADLILHAIGPTGAKHSFLARGALKSKKRFGGGILEPTHFVQLTYKEAREEGQLKVLQEAQLLQGFDGIRQNYDHLELALHVLECVGKVCQEGDENSEFLFNLTGHTLRALSTAIYLQRLKMQFYLKLLFQQGVISPDPWMSPFLRATLAQNNELGPALDQDVVEYLPSIETLIYQYLKSADAQ